MSSFFKIVTGLSQEGRVKNMESHLIICISDRNLLETIYAAMQEASSGLPSMNSPKLTSGIVEGRNGWELRVAVVDKMRLTPGELDKKMVKWGMFALGYYTAMQG